MSFHFSLSGGDVHTIIAFTFGDAGSRVAHPVSSTDIGKVARQLDDNSLWVLQTSSPVLWEGLGADPTAAATATAAYALAIAGTESGHQANRTALDAYAIAVAGTNSGQQANLTAGEAYTLAIAGTNSGAQANLTAGEAYTLAVAGTNSGQQANLTAGEAYTLAIAGTNSGQQANLTAREAYALAVEGTNAAREAYSLASSAYTLATVGTNSGQQANLTAGEAYTLAVAGTESGHQANLTGGEAYTLATAGTNAAIAAYSEATAAYQLAVIGTDAAAAAYALATIGTTATAANSLAAAASNQATAAYALASAGTITEASDFAIEDFSAYAVGQTSGFNKGIGWGSSGTFDNCVIIQQQMPFGPPINKLRIGRGQFIRQFGWGSRWRKVRMAVSARIVSEVSFTAPSGTPLWNMGICSGTLGYKSPVTDNMVAAGNFSGSGDVAYNRTAGGSSDYFLSSPTSSFQTFTRRQNTDGNNASGSATLFALSGSSHGLPVEAQWQRSNFKSTTYNMQQCPVQNVAPFNESDIGLGTLLSLVRGQDVATATVVNLNSMSGGAGSSQNITFDETTGTLDHFSFFWGDNAHPVDISCIVVWKIM